MTKGEIAKKLRTIKSMFGRENGRRQSMPAPDLPFAGGKRQKPAVKSNSVTHFIQRAAFPQLPRQHGGLVKKRR